MDDPKAPDLSRFDPMSATWFAVRDWANDKLRTYRSQLESPGLDQTQTETLRGQIVALKTLLTLAEPAPPAFRQ